MEAYVLNKTLKLSVLAAAVAATGAYAGATEKRKDGCALGF